ncbi:hypothetical protein CRG98_035946 [Punica granatum]|uniref:Uncharacterized protein n=1 Tax=Punica granatum TaxID=22663 RepID=A0A2I0II27_PUNGR|nr:hypothetical protein CRG98_035946 [Punica granatum]
MVTQVGSSKWVLQLSGPGKLGWYSRPSKVGESFAIVADNSKSTADSFSGSNLLGEGEGETQRGTGDCSIGETPLRTARNEKEKEECRCNLWDSFEHILRLISECGDYGDSH